MTPTCILISAPSLIVKIGIESLEVEDMATLCNIFHSNSE